MARLMFSAGMFSALAARTAVRSLGLPSASPPPALAATVISLIRRVNVLPRLASSAPFLCLIVAHFEWPDMGTSDDLKIQALARYARRNDPPAWTASPRARPCEYTIGRIGEEWGRE